ncbi:MAG: hypothetical protein CMF59_05595 [Leptospiraceae bacterium]|nr:hypothetical protein [Leptospiraceae bacterium]
MLRLGLLFFPVMALILFRYPAVSMDAQPALAQVQSAEIESPGKLSAQKVQLLWSDEGKRRIYQSGRILDLPEAATDRKIFVPYAGQGFFLFERMGKEIEHRSSTGELFWQRESSAYPVSSPDGDILLLITGDSNRVDVMDRNGILVEGSVLSGSLLVDYSFASPGHSDRGASALVLFSDGRYFLLGPGGKMLYRGQVSDQPLFARSAALSADGKSIAFHYDQSGKDRLQVAKIQASEEGVSVEESYNIELKTNHPYTISMLVQEEVALLGPPGETIAVNGGEIILDRVYEAAQDPGLHKAMAWMDGVFLLQEQRRMLILSGEAQLLGSFAMGALYSPGRLLHLQKGQAFYHNLSGQLRLFQLVSGSVE